MSKPFAEMANFREVHYDPLSDGGIERIKQLVDYCVQSHGDCEKPLTSLLPRRVVYIPDDGSNPRLYITKGGKHDYIALSHCWGKTQLLTTEASTIKQRQKGIKWDDLPKTFKDAIRVARILKIQYIWIDSLCILQDDR